VSAWHSRRMGLPTLPVFIRLPRHMPWARSGREMIARETPSRQVATTRKKTTAYAAKPDRGAPALPPTARQRGPVRTPLLTPGIIHLRRPFSAACGSGQKVEPKISAVHASAERMSLLDIHRLQGILTMTPRRTRLAWLSQDCAWRKRSR